MIFASNICFHKIITTSPKKFFFYKLKNTYFVNAVIILFLQKLVPKYMWPNFL